VGFFETVSGNLNMAVAEHRIYGTFAEVYSGNPPK